MKSNLKAADDEVRRVRSELTFAVPDELDDYLKKLQSLPLTYEQLRKFDLRMVLKGIKNDFHTPDVAKQRSKDLLMRYDCPKKLSDYPRNAPDHRKAAISSSATTQCAPSKRVLPERKRFQQTLSFSSTCSVSIAPTKARSRFPQKASLLHRKAKQAQESNDEPLMPDDVMSSTADNSAGAPNKPANAKTKNFENDKKTILESLSSIDTADMLKFFEELNDSIQPPIPALPPWNRKIPKAKLTLEFRSALRNIRREKAKEFVQNHTEQISLNEEIISKEHCKDKHKSKETTESESERTSAQNKRTTKEYDERAEDFRNYKFIKKQMLAESGNNDETKVDMTYHGGDKNIQHRTSANSGQSSPSDRFVREDPVRHENARLVPELEEDEIDDQETCDIRDGGIISASSGHIQQSCTEDQEESYTSDTESSSESSDNEELDAADVAINESLVDGSEKKVRLCKCIVPVLDYQSADPVNSTSKTDIMNNEDKGGSQDIDSENEGDSPGKEHECWSDDAIPRQAEYCEAKEELTEDTSHEFNCYENDYECEQYDGPYYNVDSDDSDASSQKSDYERENSDSETEQRHAPALDEHDELGTSGTVGEPWDQNQGDEDRELEMQRKERQETDDAVRSIEAALNAFANEVDEY
ncbi:hypothetical protein QR680_000215 [Steinernema hermaphroditum]|uniref:Uncharacterized protein n=1 Tax=Steinernema hermaphroditum TaxID=289476 RepID=A0AA39GVV9_9BILA|nr:hypothetical protein QR680_000215 [Steinernema hermaphroditum]